MASHWVVPPGPVADGLTIGLFGGSFNPAHDGHAYVSETALKRLKLDYVWWLVSPGNPLKHSGGMAPFAARLQSARAAAHNPRFIVTDIEQRLGTRFTVDTIAALQRRFPGVRFVWLMGSDNLEAFSRWRRWQDILLSVPVAVVQRPGSIMAALHATPVRRFGTRRTLGPTTRPPALIVIDGARSSQSATQLRALGEAQAAMLNSLY